jgi:hypothetical protein
LWRLKVLWKNFMHNKLMCRLDVVVLPFSHSECLLITAKNGNYVAEFTLPSFIVLKPKEHDKNIKGNILSFEKFMIYEFCFFLLSLSLLLTHSLFCLLKKIYKKTKTFWSKEVKRDKRIWKYFIFKIFLNFRCWLIYHKVIQSSIECIIDIPFF